MRWREGGGEGGRGGGAGRRRRGGGGWGAGGGGGVGGGGREGGGGRAGERIGASERQGRAARGRAGRREAARVGGGRTARDAGIVCSLINDIEDVKAWPHIQARGMIEDLVHPTLGPLEGLNASGYPIKFSGAETGYRSPPVMYGNDNAEIFCELIGLDAEAFEKLLADGVI